MTSKTTKAAATKTTKRTTRIPRPGHVLVLRTCKADGRSPSEAARGFVWPESGPVKCGDWSPEPRCGHGLHGLLWGEGDTTTWCWDADARWLVVEVCESEIVDLGGKVKFPRGRVVCCGDRPTATEYLRTRGGEGWAIVGGTATAGDNGIAAAGDVGTATAGYGGTATAGDGGTATAGDVGTATAGYGGTATAGYGGTATAGDVGTATAGGGGTATAGYGGVIAIQWWNGHRNRFAIREVSADGPCKPGVRYRCTESGEVVEVVEVES